MNRRKKVLGLVLKGGGGGGGAIAESIGEKMMDKLLKIKENMSKVQRAIKLLSLLFKILANVNTKYKIIFYSS